MVSASTMARPFVLDLGPAHCGQAMLGALQFHQRLVDTIDGQVLPQFTHGSIQGAGYPGADPNTIAVGAVYDVTTSGGWGYRDALGNPDAESYSTEPDAIAPFSQRDDTMTEIFAPGAPITGANASGGTVTMHGTSQASPLSWNTSAIPNERPGWKVTLPRPAKRRSSAST